ncbi:MAG TPA: pyruvate dehydrogenase (acetyl-transferring) E1 component subunit alpha [bacterium]|nr:pyruvate dehydrogenase (acetyl-transferring) E1 component subunit alpha [bacterium]
MSTTREQGLKLLKNMILIRRFEEKCAELYGEQKIRGFLHLYIGEEAVAVGAMEALRPEDAVVATYREHGHALLRGVPGTAIMAEMYGKAEGCSHGRGGSMHLFDASRRFYGGNGIVGGGLPLALGLALADKLQNRRRVTACFFGDGAMAEGEFHECANLACLWQLPVLFLCENNQYAMGTAIKRYQARTELSERAKGYGMPAEKADGMDVDAVQAAAERAAAHVREGNGPFFLECLTYRFRAHSMFDPDLYRTKEEIAKWKERDPIPAFQGRLRKAGLLAEGDTAAIEAEAQREVAEAVAFAESGTWEPVETLTKDVYALREAL